MSLVSGPGRGGTTSQNLPDEIQLVIEPHVKYIQSLDTVSGSTRDLFSLRSCTDSVEMN